jgi:hypothetical protein
MRLARNGPPCKLAQLAGLLCFALTSAANSGELVLFDFAPPFEPTQVSVTDATVRLVASDAGSALRVETGTAQTWPGITLVARDGRWNLSAYSQVTLRLRNVGEHQVTVHCRVDSDDVDGKARNVTQSLTISPGAEREMQVPLQRTSGDTLGGKLFGMRGYPAKNGGDQTIDPTKVTQLLVFVGHPTVANAFEIRDIRASGEWVSPTAWTTDANPYFPLIDMFGQYRHQDWPGKTHSLAELLARRTAEEKELRKDRGPRDWNSIGGWSKGPRRKANGFFRVEKVYDKWWFVDPEGRLFWSHGIDCVGALDQTPIEQRQNWFEEFSDGQRPFESFISPGHVLKGHYAGAAVRCFSFAGANLQRKYGDDWKQVSASVVHRRLRHWGLNTIGNWSSDDVRSLRRTPYVDAIASNGAVVLEGSDGYWGKFPDVYDTSFERMLHKSMADRGAKSANDPWCIGYFCDNELSWGDDISLAVATLRSPARQAAKQAFVVQLQKKYADIVALNQVWGTSHNTWESLADSRDAPPDVLRARPDLQSFYSQMADAYFSTVRRVIRAAAPKQLFLGCRFSGANDLAAAAAARHCDVVSFNLYQHTIADFTFSGGDVPLLIGEFHFGALDRGLFHAGLVPVQSQKARAEAYQQYVESALRHPQFVGCHWFQYQDEPTTGRYYDEENYQIGFVDIADTPYSETTEMSRRVGDALYKMRNAPN